MFIAYWPTACLKIMILVICFIPPGTCTHVILQKGVILMIFSIMVMENKNAYGRLISAEQLTRFMLPGDRIQAMHIGIL